MILVIGSNGMLGKDVVKKLIQDRISFKEVIYPEIDVTSLKSCKHSITCDVSCVINCSGYTAVDKAEEDVINAFNVNAIGPKNIAIASELVGAKIIHISTDYVFDGFDQESYSELDIPNPISVYGKSKLLGEEYVREFSSKFFILRTSWLFGSGGNNFIKTMINNKDREVLNVVSDQFGAPTSTVDLTNTIMQLIDTEAYGVYHATSEGRTSWYEFAKYVFEKINVDVNLKPCSTDQYPTAAVRPANSQLDSLMLAAQGFELLNEWQVAVDNYLKEEDLV